MRPKGFSPWMDERGTASLEMLLTLPTILLILVLMVDLGYGWILKTKVEAAARFAGTEYIRTPRGVDGRGLAQQALEEHYDALEVRDLRISGRKRTSGATLEGPVGWRRILQPLASRLPRLSSSRRVTFAVQRTPLFGTLLPSTDITTVFVIDKNPWNYDRSPLGLDDLMKRASDLETYRKEADGIVSGPLLATLGTLAFLLALPLRFLFKFWGMIP